MASKQKRDKKQKKSGVSQIIPAIKKKLSGAQVRKKRKERDSNKKRNKPYGEPDLDSDFQFAGESDGSSANNESSSPQTSLTRGLNKSDDLKVISNGKTKEKAASKELSKAARKAEKKVARKQAKIERKMEAKRITEAPAVNKVPASEVAIPDALTAETGQKDDQDTNGITENADFISLNFPDSETEAEDEPTAEQEQRPNAFQKVAAKLGKFVQESINPLKRKRGKESTASKPSKQPKSVAREKDPYPWLEKVSYRKEQEPARILHHELLDFVKFVGPTEGEHLVRTFVISRVQKIIEHRWPSASLHVFGSFETKLYLPTSDIDLVVLSGSNGGELYEKPAHLRKLANWLVKARIAEGIQVITSARVPIIKFVDSVTKINVDISFNKPGGLVAAGVVKRYTETMPALRPLVIFIKHFLNMRGMNEVYLGGLGSYSIICMVISFLQRHPKVASGQVLQEENLGVLVVEFFELYGKRFNYDNVGISINNEGTYFNKIDHGWQRPGQSYLLSIEDPTDPDNDIAKSSFGILKVKSTLGGGHDFLVQRLYDLNDRIKERRRGDLRDDSVLGAVVSIDDDMKESRAIIAESFQSDIVQEELARLDTSEGEIHEVPSLDTKAWEQDHKAKNAHTGAPMFVEENESEDDGLIDDDGLKFVRPEGYKKPFQPGDVNDIYKRLDNNGQHTKHESTNGQTGDHIYLIESSDEGGHVSTTKPGEIIDLDSSEDENDSKVAQVEKATRARYWDSKGVDKSVLSVDDYDTDPE